MKVTMVNSLPNDKILDWSKLKAYAGDKINVTAQLKFVMGRVENIVGKGENAFSPFPAVFSKVFIFKELCGKEFMKSVKLY